MCGVPQNIELYDLNSGAVRCQNKAEKQDGTETIKAGTGRA